MWANISLGLIFFVPFITIVVFILALIRLEYNLKSYVTVPGLPIFGNFFAFTNLKGVLRQTLQWTEMYGNKMKVNVFMGFSAVIFTDLNLIEFILSTTNILNKSMTYVFLENWLGRGLLTATEEKWKKTRKIITPAFHFQILEHYVHTFHSSSMVLIEKLKTQIGKEPFDIYPYITLCTLDIICESAMGTKVNAQMNSQSEYVTGVKELCRIIIERSLNPLKMFPTYVFTKDFWLERRYLKVLHGYTNSVIKTRRAQLSSDNTEIITTKKRLAFLDLLLQAKIDGRPMTDYEIRQEVDTFMFEGHDTTSSGISFALYCLSTNPDVQDKVVQEIGEILSDDIDKQITIKQLQEMAYLDMVIKESMRMFPPVPVIGRMPLRNVAFGKTLLPTYAQAIIFIYGVHHNPEIYPEPHVFNPDRFLPENKINSHPFSYLPFSAGPRNCIGQKFAMLEMKTAIVHILQHFVLKPVKDYAPEIMPYTVLKSANGIMVQLEKRL